jgi:putative phosphoesterase
MRTLIFSDIHADKKAAKFIQTIASGFDELLCCGDICGYGKDFKYCIDTFKSLNVKAVLGNHDKMVINPNQDFSDIIDVVAEPLKWTREKIGDKEMAYLYSLPIFLETENSNIYMRHTLGIDEYVTNKGQCLPLLDSTTKPIVAIGHTHVMAEYRFGNRVVVNAGSISKGRKNTNAGYVIVEDGNINLREVSKWR